MDSSLTMHCDERFAAVLITDLVDSTRLSERMGERAARHFWSEHDRATRELLRRFNGREVGRSDGFLVVFDECDDALDFALSYHGWLSTQDGTWLARVGMHWGRVLLRQNSDADWAVGATRFEIDGLVVPLASRIMSAAAPGGTLLSAEATKHLSDCASRDAELHALGYWRLKGLAEPVQLFGVAYMDQESRPNVEGSKAYRVVHRGGQWVPVANVPNNLQPEPDAFIGREETLHGLTAACDEGARLITLVGTGGVGKTRVAQRFARSSLGEFPGGAWFCDLSTARSVDGIVHAVAQALGVGLTGVDPVQQLGAAIDARGECLILLDNFEQVVRCASSTVGTWLQVTTQTRFLVTSREVLGLVGERVETLAPMPSVQARALFIQRMHDSGVRDRLESKDAAALPTLVELLDGLPLAIEIAAARTRVIAPADMVARMGQRFRLLSTHGGRRDRQATLHATLDWSWNLLDSAEQSALTQLSVFEGGFTLVAAEAVLDLSTLPAAPWVGDALQSLVEKSLVRRAHAGRFDLLRSVQDYAVERRGGEDSAALRRHWRYYATGDVDAASDIDNLIIACERAAGAAPRTGNELECAVMALDRAWAALRLMGPFHQGAALASALAAIAELSDAQRARVLRVWGSAAQLLGNAEAAREHFTRALPLARAAGDIALEARLSCFTAVLDWHRGDREIARCSLHRAMQLAPEDAELQVLGLNALGDLALADADHQGAEACFTRALGAAESIGDLRWLGGLHGNLGVSLLGRGAKALARTHFDKALRLAIQVGDRQWAGNTRCNLGWLLHELGEDDLARVELTIASQIAAQMGYRRLEATALCNLGLVEVALGHTDEALERLSGAVARAEALKDPRIEGQFRGYLGEVLGQAGFGHDAWLCLDEAIRLLAPLGDQISLAMVRCQRTLCAQALGDSVRAAAELAAAEEVARQLSVATESDLSRALTRARETQFA